MASSSRSGHGYKDKKIISFGDSNPFGRILDKETRGSFTNDTFKIIANPMNINLNMFKREGFKFPMWLEKQELSDFIQIKGNWYPNLVKTFYHNLRVVNNEIYSRVKDMDIHINDFVWNIVSNLPSESVYSHLPKSEMNTLLNKKHVYQEWLRFPDLDYAENVFAHEGVLKEEKIMAHLLVKIILPGTSRTDRMTTEEIYLLHVIKNGNSTNWLQVVKDHMEYTTIIGSLYLPYVCLINKVLVLLRVDIKNEQKCIWNSSNVFDKDSLMSLGLVKTINEWKFMDENTSESISTKEAVGTDFFLVTNFEKYVAEQIRILHEKYDSLAMRKYDSVQPVTESYSEENSSEPF